jgi:hypothetical protein
LTVAAIVAMAEASTVAVIAKTRSVRGEIDTH